MIITRLLSLLFIIGSAVFASYFGGNISYALFMLLYLYPLYHFSIRYMYMFGLRYINPWITMWLLRETGIIIPL